MSRYAVTTVLVIVALVIATRIWLDPIPRDPTSIIDDEIYRLTEENKLLKEHIYSHYSANRTERSPVAEPQQM